MRPHIVEITGAPFDKEIARGNRILTSLEGANPGGSIKDHMVKNELESWLRAGKLRKGDRVSELSAGSTAASLAHYCPELGLRCVLYLPSTAPADLIARLQSQGAEVHLLNPATAYPEYEEECRKHDYHPFNQLFDPGKSRHYASFGAQVAASAGHVDAVIGAVGTGHSLLGIAHGARCPAISAEPLPPWKIPGCRNVEFERHGSADKCSIESFDMRICIASGDANFPGQGEVSSNTGGLEVSQSFLLVLSAAKRFLDNRSGNTIFLVGAANKRRQSDAVYLRCSG